jgi:hypothetical protein
MELNSNSSSREMSNLPHAQEQTSLRRADVQIPVLQLTRQLIHTYNMINAVRLCCLRRWTRVEGRMGDWLVDTDHVYADVTWKSVCRRSLICSCMLLSFLFGWMQNYYKKRNLAQDGLPPRKKKGTDTSKKEDKRNSDDYQISPQEEIFNGRYKVCGKRLGTVRVVTLKMNPTETPGAHCGVVCRLFLYIL